MAVTELSVSVRLAPDDKGTIGISADAEDVINDIIYYRGRTVDDVLCMVEGHLQEVIHDLSVRAAQPEPKAPTASAIQVHPNQGELL